MVLTVCKQSSQDRFQSMVGVQLYQKDEFPSVFNTCGHTDQHPSVSMGKWYIEQRRSLCKLQHLDVAHSFEPKQGRWVHLLLPQM